MHVVRLKLLTTAYDEAILEKRFHAISHIHNVLVKHAKYSLKKLSCDKEYQSLKAEYILLLKKNKLSVDEKSYKKQLSSRLSDIVITYGLSEYSFQSYIKLCAKQFRKSLSSQQVQKEATRVWEGTQKVLYGNGKELHFKKFKDFDTICGKTNTNGIKFNKSNYSITWNGLNIRCKLPKDKDYITEALDSDISYCELKRLMFPNGWHYYVNIYLKGDAPHKIKDTGSVYNTTGVDIGTSTVATVSEDKVTLKELAPLCNKYNKKIQKTLKSMDISKRISNPDKFKEDGTIDRSNHDKWVYSKTYLKNLKKLKSLYRQKAAYIKQSHEEMIKELLTNSVNFIVEDMSFKGLQRKSKTTERSDKISEIKQKNGSVKRIHKYKRKKRFGKSLNNRAPASFITILTTKASLYGGSVCKVNTKEFKASKYDHVADTYISSTLAERDKYVGKHKVQRDLYSAFLLKNSNDKLNRPDKDKCIYGFDGFLKLQNELITQMKKNNISMKQCFGF